MRIVDRVLAWKMIKEEKKERDLECRVAVPPPRSTRDEESFRNPQKSLAPCKETRGTRLKVEEVVKELGKLI